ncbi:MAG: M56 family metallopeptidase [Planctomycetaceae bacterium]|nr:M56 family metallopeptidase [Planctomycetaceae bacterium]
MNRTILMVAGVFSASSLLLVDSAVKGTALLMLAAVAAMILRRDSAATRHLVWLLAIVAMLAVPVLSAMLPQWRVLPEWASIPPATAVVATSPPTIAMPADGAFELPQNAEPDEVESPSASAYQPAAALPDSRPALVTPEAIPASAVWSWNWLDALPLVWAIGFCVLILRLMAARLMLWNTQRHGTVIWSSRQPAKATHDTIVTALEAVCLQLGIGRPVTLLVHPDKTIPVVWGILRCRLLLPAAARQWTGEQLRSVLLHELAHIKRRDTLAQLLAQIACALHWFNPLVWFAAWRLGVERERACDDLVLAFGVRPSAYAGHLLEVVTGLSPARWTHSCGLAMARKSSLEGRLVAVLSENLNRRGVSVALAAIALAIAVGIAVPVAMLRTAGDVSSQEEVADKTQAEDSHMVVLRDSNAVFLLNQWQELEGRKTPLSEASLARLRLAIDKWVKQPSAKAEADRVRALRDRNIERAEHPVTEVEAWLDEIAAIHPGPLAFAISNETLVGVTMSEERQAALKFGAVATNGLRAAWSRYPARETYLPGDAVDSSLVIQNVSERTVEFECPHSLENIVTWEVKSADGRTIEAQAARIKGTFPLFIWQLKPGAIAEIYGRGVAIGVRPEEVNNSTWFTDLQAKLGEQVTVRWKVREPAEMTTGEVSFKVVGIEDVPVWSTSQAGKWPLPGGVTLEVKQVNVHATDIMSTAILTWPVDRAGGTARHQIFLGGDAFAIRDPWLLAWEHGASVLWEMSGELQSSQAFHKVKPTPISIRRIDFSNPNDINETTWYYVPDLVPDAIRAEFDREFLPLVATPPTPAHANPGVQSARAEDVRPVKELLSGTWKSAKGYMDGRITFPERPSDWVHWKMTFERPQGNATVSERLAPMDSPQDASVRLTKPRRQPRTPGVATLGRLKRGIGDTILLDIMPHVDFPEYERAYGIVLERVSAPVQPQALKPDARAREESQKPKDGAKLKPATEQKLKWGEPANGLRMALAWPPSLGEPGMGDAPEFYLVVQNVSQAAVRLTANDAAPNPRRLMMRENGRPLQAISDPVPTPGDWLLQPREVAFFRLYQSNAEWKGGRTISSAIEQDIRTVPRYSMTAEMTIEKAPAGAWTGKLATGETRGSVDVIPPKHKDAQSLYKSWTTAARADGKIPRAGASKVCGFQHLEKIGWIEGTVEAFVLGTAFV